MSTELIKPLPLPESGGDLRIENFPSNGCAEFGEVLDPDACTQIRDWIDRQRPLSPEIFYQSPQEFSEKGRWHRYAPGIGHNLLEGEDLRVIEQNPGFCQLGRTVGRIGLFDNETLGHPLDAQGGYSRMDLRVDRRCRAPEPKSVHS